MEFPIGVVTMTSTACGVPPGAGGAGGVDLPVRHHVELRRHAANFTAVALVKPEPSRMTKPPPATAPKFGVMDKTAGLGGFTGM